MQAVVLTGVVWLERIVWLTNQSQLFLVPHSSSQSTKNKILVQELISIILLNEFPVIIKIPMQYETNIKPLTNRKLPFT